MGQTTCGGADARCSLAMALCFPRSPNAKDRGHPAGGEKYSKCVAQKNQKIIRNAGNDLSSAPTIHHSTKPHACVPAPGRAGLRDFECTTRPSPRGDGARSWSGLRLHDRGLEKDKVTPTYLIRLAPAAICASFTDLLCSLHLRASLPLAIGLSCGWTALVLPLFIHLRGLTILRAATDVSEGESPCAAIECEAN